MKAYVFPGQASQFKGMGKDMYESSEQAKELFERANELLGFRITDVMFYGSEEDLKQTKITQPAVFLHSVVRARLAGEAFRPDMVAGHSLGEFSALVASNALDFESGLTLVLARALAMQKACEAVEGTMAAVIGLEDAQVEAICSEVSGTVVAANYNCPGQLVISGALKSVEQAIEKAKEAGAKMAVLLPVGGAFHSPLMAPAREELRAAIEKTNIEKPTCPIYQNVNALPETRPDVIRQNLIEQLTAPVRWTQTMLHMIANGATHFYEVGGNGKTLRAFVKRIDRNLPADELI